MALALLAEGFTSPIAMVQPEDGSERLFVADQVGKVWIIDGNQERIAEPFLDVSGRMVSLSSSYDERGLLGLALHPEFAVNGRFFVYYTAPKDDSVPADFNAMNRLSEFRVSAGDPDLADADSERVIIEIDSPQTNHDGGDLAFGPDGYLYIASGDGGGGNDVGVGHTPETGNGQDKTTLLGKILRIDVDGDDPYEVPPDNPFVNDAGARGEIWALGLRNPWRFSFDSGGERRLFAGDVGQELFEEVNIIRSGGNYGWNVREGVFCFDASNAVSPPSACAEEDAEGNAFDDPIIAYSHSDDAGRSVGISAVGGYVYRGEAIPELVGQYIFGDFSTGFIAADGSLFAAEEDAGGSWELRELRIDSGSGRTNGRIGRFVLAFAEDSQGELYILTSARLGPAGSTGQVYKIIRSGSGE